MKQKQYKSFFLMLAMTLPLMACNNNSCSCSHSNPLPSSTENSSINNNSTSIGTSIGEEPYVDIEIQKPELITEAQLKEKYNENNKITINFWTGFGSVVSKEPDKSIAVFEEQYPYISINHEKQGGYDGLHSKVMQSLASNSYPHVVVGYPDHFADYISSNVQYELNDYIESEEYGVDIDDYYEQYMRENNSLMFKDDAKTQPYTMGIPFNKSTEVMVYNKTFFDAFDLTVPETWDDAITVGKEIISIIKGTSSKLTRAEDKVNHFGTIWKYKVSDEDEKPVTFDFTGVQEKDVYPLSYDSQSNFFITMCNQFGGKYTEMGDTIEKGYLRFKGDQKVIEALNFVKSMNTQHILGIPSTWNATQYCSAEFKALKSFMTISSSAGVTNNIASGNKFEVGIAPIPYKTADKKSVVYSGTNMAILKSDAEHALASWLFIRFMTGGVTYKKTDKKTGAVTTENENVNFAIASGYLPVNKSGEESDKYQQHLASTASSISDNAKIAVQKVANDIYVKQNWDKFVDPAFVGSSDIRTQVGNIIPFILTGASGKIYTPEEAIDYVYKKLPQYVKH